MEKKITTFNLDKKTKDKLDRIATYTGRSKSEMIRWLIEHYKESMEEDAEAKDPKSKKS
jgi:predicted DNA-binding protein